jgi:hypothetical protein
MLKTLVQAAVLRFGYTIVSRAQVFRQTSYIRINSRRLEHLASLRIPIAGMTVLEVGAGIGDLSSYYADRGNPITITEGREENLALVHRYYPKDEYPHVEIRPLDMEEPTLLPNAPFDLIHCYGLLYHLRKAERAIAYMSESCKRLLLLETCVSYGSEELTHLLHEPSYDPTQAMSGTGCRPTRSWIFSQLKRHFEYVYVPRTQPNHREFPIDWTTPPPEPGPLTRAIFIASRESLHNALLSGELLDHQIRHE